MADIYIYDGNADDLDCMGLVGALSPVSCTHEENANGMSELEITHPYDEYGKWATLEIGRIVKAPVPVRTCPEIADGQIVTSVETWTVLATATKAQRYVYSKRRGGKKKKLLKPGTSVTVVLKPAESERYKIRTGNLNGWIASAALQYEATEVIGSDPGAIDEVAPAWTVRDQLFRIYSVQKKNSGVVARARHISYDLLGNNTTYIESGTMSAQVALDAILGNCVSFHEFEAFTDSANTRTGMDWENVNPIDALLEEENGFAARFGCELVRDDYELYLLTAAGKNRGVRIEYGKNLEDVTADIDTDNLITRIIPVGETKAGDKLYLTDDEDGQNWIDSSYIGNYAEPHIHILECSDCKVGSGGVTTALARTRMRAQAEQMFMDGCDVPAMKLTVNFVSLAGTDQYRDYADLEKVFLYDTVSVYHTHIGVTASAKVTRGVWNVLLERWDSMDLETSEFTTPAWEDYFRNSLRRLRDEAKQQLFRLSVEYSNGTCLDSDTTSTTATVHLFKNNADVTDKHAASCFSWTRATKTGTAEQLAADATWNAAHVGTKSVTLGIADIDGNAVIRCNAVIQSKTATYELTSADTVFFKRDGKDGSKIEYIFALTATNAAPALDTAAVQTDDYVPSGWTDDPAGISLTHPFEWMSMRVKDDGAWDAFTSPALWAHYGKDGDTVEYIFCRTTAFETPALTTAAIQQDDYVPSGWEDDAQGIDAEHPYEWMAMRTKSDELWSAFTTPTLWSHYGADGADGNDGTLLEYVYARSATDTAPTLDTAAVQTNDYIPTGWQDEPVTLDASYPYGWMAIRSKTAGTWSVFSSPALWAHYGKDGERGTDGSVTEYIYSRTSTETAPALNTAAVQTDEHIPSDWTDDPTGVNVSYPFEWVSTRIKQNRIWSAFTSPALWAKYGKDGTDGTSVEYIFRRTATASAPALNTAAVQTNEYVPSDWTDDPSGVDASYPYEWVSTRTKTNGTWSAFTSPALWTHFGKDGEDGADGVSVEYIYRRTANDTVPALTTTAVQTDGHIPTGWTNDANGVNASYPYEWISSRSKVNDVWSAFSSPVIWTHFGKDGTNGSNGVDGGMTEYIYRRTSSSSAPTLTTTAVQTDGHVPSGWTDEPTGVDATNPYEWISTRKKVAGVWGAFSSPALWTHFGKDGERGADGNITEYVYCRTSTQTTPALNTAAVQTDDYVPSGWTDNPTGVNGSYPYEWISTRIKANGTWSAFTSPALWAKYGADGTDGTSVEYIYCRTTTASAPALNTAAVQTNDYVPSDWTDNPTGVNDANPYEWISTRTKTGGTWSVFTTPALWAKYGQDGVDGSSVEYIFCRASTTATPTLNTAAVQQDDYVPSGWTDDPTGVSALYPYEWVSTRTKVGGTWGAFAAPKLWAHYGKDGEDGADGQDGAPGANGRDGTSTEYVYRRTTTASAPSLTTTAVQTDDYVPSGWTDNPSGVNVSYPYEWVSTRVKQNGVWSVFTVPAIWSHYGTDGSSIEYVYRRTAVNSAPALTTTAVQSDDYVPSGWTDNPSGVTSTYLYEWVSTRTKVAGTWSAFTSPTLWAKYGQDGAPGTPGAPGAQGLPGADGTKVYYSSSYPSGSGYKTGDLWYVISGTSVIALYRYTGSSWSQLRYDTGALVVGNIVTGSAVANVLTAAMVNALSIYTNRIYSASYSAFNATVGATNSAWGYCGLDFYYNGTNMGSVNVDSSHFTVVGERLRLIGYGGLECHTSRYNIGFTINEEGGSINWTGDMFPSVTSTSSSSGYRLGMTDYRWRHVYVRSGNYTGSDLRIKENIEAMDERAVAFILSLRPLEYTLTGDEPDQRHWGFGAQHVKESLDAVGYKADHNIYEHENEDNLGLNYQELLAPLVYTVKTQERRITALEEENKALKARLDAQESRLDTIERRLEGSI